jgi:hypothetical protein
MPKELERTPGTGCDQRRISGGAALQCSSARSRTACSRFARDHRDPAGAVADDEGAMPVGLDAWRDVAGGFELQQLDAAGHRALAR